MPTLVIRLSMNRIATCVFLLLLAVVQARAAKIRVSSFSTILTEIATQVGGDRVAVTGHVKPGMDPHDFEPRASDLKVVSNADLVLLSAKHMEGYVGKLARRDEGAGSSRSATVSPR